MIRYGRCYMEEKLIYYEEICCLKHGIEFFMESFIFEDSFEIVIIPVLS